MFVCSCLKFAKIFLKLCRKCAFECYFIRLSKQLNGKFLRRKMFIKLILSELSLRREESKKGWNEKIKNSNLLIDLRNRFFGFSRQLSEDYPPDSCRKPSIISITLQPHLTQHFSQQSMTNQQ
jgi:hypothetical protein